MLAVVINDSVFAVILGASFTSTIALMAWIVKTLAGLSVRVDVNEGRIRRLEAARWGQFGRTKVKTLVVILLVLVAAFWIGLFGKIQTDAQRRRDACVQDQELYDGHITYTRFLAQQFHATPAQTARGIADLKKVIGPRPSC